MSDTVCVRNDKLSRHLDKIPTISLSTFPGKIPKLLDPLELRKNNGTRQDNKKERKEEETKIANAK
jgi:hypothetical protein